MLPPRVWERRPEPRQQGASPALEWLPGRRRDSGGPARRKGFPRRVWLPGKAGGEIPRRGEWDSCRWLDEVAVLGWPSCSCAILHTSLPLFVSRRLRHRPNHVGRHHDRVDGPHSSSCWSAEPLAAALRGGTRRQPWGAGGAAPGSLGPSVGCSGFVSSCLGAPGCGCAFCSGGFCPRAFSISALACSASARAC